MSGGFGGMVSVVIDGDLDRTRKVLERVEVFTLARTCASVGWTMPRLAPEDPVNKSHLARAVMWARKVMA